MPLAVTTTPVTVRNRRGGREMITGPGLAPAEDEEAAMTDVDADDRWIEIVAPKVMAMHAQVGHQLTPGTTWTVEYARDTVDDKRFVIARLHASAAEAEAVVEIGAMAIGDTFGTVTPPRHGVYAAALSDALGLDMLYDIAVITARGMFGTLGDGAGLDAAAYPTPEIAPMDDGTVAEVL